MGPGPLPTNVPHSGDSPVGSTIDCQQCFTGASARRLTSVTVARVMYADPTCAQSLLRKAAWNETWWWSEA